MYERFMNLITGILSSAVLCLCGRGFLYLTWWVFENLCKKFPGRSINTGYIDSGPFGYLAGLLGLIAIVFFCGGILFFVCGVVSFFFPGRVKVK